jgi:hypothetical protein
MNKLIKTVILAGSLVAATAVVSFADGDKTADKAPAAGSGSAAAPKGKATTKSTPKTAPKGGGSASK